MIVKDINAMLATGAAIHARYFVNGSVTEGLIGGARLRFGVVQVQPVGSQYWETLQSYRSVSVDSHRAVMP